MPSATEYHDPVWLVQCAWSACRLAELQVVVRSIIEGLQALAPCDVLGNYWARPSFSERLPDPGMEALRACTEELRDACGIAGSQVALAAHGSLMRRYIAQQPRAWGEAFKSALNKYRHLACAELLVTLPRASSTS